MWNQQRKRKKSKALGVRELKEPNHKLIKKGTQENWHQTLRDGGDGHSECHCCGKEFLPDESTVTRYLGLSSMLCK